MSEHQFDESPKKEVHWRDSYCDHMHSGDRFSRVGDNANMESNLVLSPDDCIDTEGDRHPHYKKRMSAAEKLAAKKLARKAKPISVEPEEAKLTKVEIEGETADKEEDLVIQLGPNIAPSAPVKLSVTQGASDVTDIAWDLCEVFRHGGYTTEQERNEFHPGSFGPDQVDLTQIHLDNFFAGNNADLEDGVKSARADPTGHDFTKQIQNPQKVSTCVLFDPPTDHETSNEDVEAPQSGLRIHQLTVWHILRAMATAQRSDYEKLFVEWKAKHKPFTLREDYDKRPNAYMGFKLNREIKHDGKMTPRGILINHSTGSGKTAVSVSALQAFWFQSDRPLLYVSTAKAVSQVIGARAKIERGNDENDCGGVAQRSEYARLAQLFFPNTLGSDENAFDPVLSGATFANAKNAACVQTYLGNPANVASRLKAITFTQLHEFILESGSGKLVNDLCKTPTVIAGVTRQVAPKFGANNQKSVANAVIIVDEAHNLLQTIPDAELFNKEIETLTNDISKNRGNTLLTDKLASLKETFACQEIYKYLLKEESQGITLIFLTATPGSNPIEIDKLCRVLRRKEDDETLVSYYDAVNNRSDFPKMQKEITIKTELTNEQMIQIARMDAKYDMLRESTISPSAIKLLPSSSRTRLLRAGALAGGESAQQLLEKLNNASNRISKEQIIIEINKLRGNNDQSDLKKLNKEELKNLLYETFTKIEAARPLPPNLEAEAAPEAATEQQQDGAPAQEQTTAPVSVNENMEDAVYFDNRHTDWRRRQIQASENLTEDEKQLILKAVEKKSNYAGDHTNAVFSATNFSGDNFEKRAPKIAAVARRIVEGIPMKTFVYSAYAEATEGVFMLLEHKHGWRRISDKVLSELKTFLNLDVNISNDTQSLEELEERVSQGNYQALLDTVTNMIAGTISLLEKLSSQNTAAPADSLPELEHMRHLNREIPKSLRDLMATAKRCSEMVEQIRKMPKDEANEMSRLHELQKLAADIIGAHASAQNMEALLINIENGDIAKQISNRLNQNELVVAEQADASDLNPRGGKPRKRFVILNETNAKTVLAVFNHFLNRDGDIIMAILANGSAVEGLDLKTTRRVIAVEPMISQVKLQQLIGRARRYCSHAELPVEFQEVSFNLFYSVNNPLFRAEATRLKDEWKRLRAELKSKREQFQQTANSEIMTKSNELEEKIHDLERQFETALRAADQIRQKVANTRDRLREAQSTGGVAHYIAIRLNGELAGLKSVTYQAALLKCEELTAEIVNQKSAYLAIQKSLSADVKARLASFKPFYERIETIERDYADKYLTSIYSTTKFYTESVEETTMTTVQNQQIAIDASIGYLRDRAADKDILHPIMEFFAR
jgi:hypothetical protein